MMSINIRNLRHFIPFIGLLLLSCFARVETNLLYNYLKGVAL